jgi:hypothetical protein
MSNEKVTINISNSLVKGIKNAYPAEFKDEVTHQRFIEEHAPKFLMLIPYLPKKCRATVGAIVVKCAMIFGLNKALEFAKAVKDGTFNGVDDPVHLLWLYLETSKSYKQNDVYGKTLTAARAFCQGKKLQGLRVAKVDLFEWTPEHESALREIEEELRTLCKEAG